MRPTKAQALDLVGVPGFRFEGRVLSRKALGLGLRTIWRAGFTGRRRCCGTKRKQRMISMKTTTFSGMTSF